MSTSVPTVTFGPNGFIAPASSVVLAGVIADYQLAFNNQLNLSTAIPSSLSTPQGQLASSTTAIIDEVNATFLLQSTQTDPAYAFGRWQDAIGRIYFLERDPSQPTVLQIACDGLENVTIPVGQIIVDSAQNQYACSQAGTIPAGGSITLPFAALIPGPTPVPGTNAVEIFQTISGWDSVTVVSGVIGNDTESRSAFEARRAATVAGNSFGAIGSIIGAVAKVPNVIDYFGYDNGDNSPVTIAGVTVAANSIFICVAGGDQGAIAQAILSKKAPGCSYTGNTTVTAYDSNPLYATPIPYSVKFEIPAALAILFSVNIVNNAQVPANATTLIQNAIINAFAGGDGGQRARIGTTLLASRYYAPVALLGPWAQIIAIDVGSTNNSDTASFTGAIAGTALTVSGVTGTIAIGQTVIDTTGNIIAGTTIVSGSGSSWVVSQSQTVGSEAMKSASANKNSVSVNGDQVPTITAADIQVVLT